MHCTVEISIVQIHRTLFNTYLMFLKVPKNIRLDFGEMCVTITFKTCKWNAAIKVQILLVSLSFNEELEQDDKEYLRDAVRQGRLRCLFFNLQYM